MYMEIGLVDGQLLRLSHRAYFTQFPMMPIFILIASNDRAESPDSVLVPIPQIAYMIVKDEVGDIKAEETQRPNWWKQPEPPAPDTSPENSTDHETSV